jgi:paraquat-inducible protein A
MERALALTFAAAITFLVANVFPFVTISAAGRMVRTTILGSIVQMWDQGMILVSSMVFLNAIAVPGGAILATGYVLAHSRSGRPPGHLIDVLRFLQMCKPWGMVEVFLLGLLVSIVKLGSYARVIPDVALWAIGALVLLTAALATVFEPGVIWMRIDARRFSRGAGGESTGEEEGRAA